MSNFLIKSFTPFITLNVTYYFLANLQGKLMDTPVLVFARRFGRVILASLFLLAALNKILNPQMMMAMMREGGLPLIPMLFPATIALEGIGGALVARGGRLAVPAALVLAVFTLATNALFHQFWSLTGHEAALEVSLFFKNVSIAGGLIYVAAMEALALQTLDDKAVGR
jgi:putative oxidoreductase